MTSDHGLEKPGLEARPAWRRPLGMATAFAAAAYLALGAWYFLRQESLLFLPTKLATDHRFELDLPFEELWLDAPDGIRLHALLIRAAQGGASSAGAAYYLHGNGGSLDSWAPAAGPFVRAGLDVLMLDYRGYGKSGGTIESEEQLFADVELGYRWLAERYGEERLVVVGYSLGTGPATSVGCARRPKRIVLHAPYSSIVDAGRHAFPLLRLYPAFLFRYPLRNDEALARCPAPVAIFHGERDALIPIEASERLATLFKPGDRLIRMPEAGHGNLRRQPDYEALLHEVLAEANPSTGG